MTASWFDLDIELCGRLCLMLAHSLWQFALLAGLAAVFARLWKNATPEMFYAFYAATLLLGLVALPITFVLTRLPGESVALSDMVTIPQQALSPLPNPALPEEWQTEQAAPPYLASKALEFLTDTPANQTSSTQSWLAWAPWLMGGYAAGVVFMLLRLIRGLWRNYRLSARAKPIASGPLFDALQTLTRTWSMRVLPALAHASDVVVPQVIGVLRPTILFPASAISGLTTEELEMILAHELAHIRRHDLWVNLVQRLAETVLFYNPGLWYLSRRISTYREYCCDELTCQLPRREQNDSRLCYANALLRVVELGRGQARHGELAALAASGNRPSELRRRVARLFGEPLREPIGLSRKTIIALLAGVLLIIAGPVTWQNAAETGGESEKKTQTTHSRPKVEVVAIGTHDEEPQRWWDAEGKLLETVPFDWTDANNVSSSEKVWRRVVFRINHLAEDAKVTWQIQGGGASGDATGTPKNGGETASYFARYFGVPARANEFGLRIGIAGGPWKSAATSSHGLSATARLGRGIVTSNVFPSDGGSVVVVSHNYDGVDFRVVAASKDGQRFTTEKTRAVSASDVNLAQWYFDKLEPDDIDHFEFQTRDYEWTEIKDLPVEPANESPDKRSAANNRPNPDPRSYFYILPVTTELQRMLLHNDRTSTYLNVNGKAFMAKGETAFRPADGGREVIEQALSELPPAAKAGLLYVRVDFGYQKYDERKSDELKSEFTELAKTVGFTGSEVTSSWSNEDDYTWQAFDSEHALQDVTEPVATVGNARIFAVKTPLSRLLTGNVDCYIELFESLPSDAASVFSAYDELRIRQALRKMDFDKREKVQIRVRLKPPQEKTDEQFVPQQKKDSRFQLDAAELLQDAGFEEVLVLVEVKGVVTSSRYKTSLQEQDASEPGREISATLREWHRWWNTPIAKKTESQPRRQIKEFPLSDADGWRRFWHAFVNDPNSGLAVGGVDLPNWLQPREQGSEITSYKIRSKEQFWKTFESHFDAMADFPGLFEGMVEGIMRDPNGPQVDFSLFVKDHLGDEFIVVKSPGKSVTAKGHRYLVAWSTNNTPQVEKILGQFMRADPNAELTTIGNTPVWKMSGTDDEPPSGACVFDNHLIEVTDLALLQEVLTQDKSGAEETNIQPPPSKQREMRVKVVDEDGKPIEGAELFRNHAYFEIEGERSQFENETYYTDANGNAVIPLSGQTRILRIWAREQEFVPQFANWEKDYHPDGDQIPETFEFRLKRGTKISGVVTNVAGIPIPGVRVEVEDAVAIQFSIDRGQLKPVQRPVRDSHLAYGSAAARTDAEGRWSLDNVPTDEELALSDKESTDEHTTPLRLRFSHPDYETIDGIEDWQTVWNPPLESLRDATAHTVMKRIERDDHGRVNAVRLEQGEQYRNADFSGRHFKGQRLMVWSDNMLAGAKLTDSTWEEMMIPGMANLLHDANASGARFISVQVTGQSSGMQKTNFQQAELESANLSGGVSAFQEANFRGATIGNCDLMGGASAFQTTNFQDSIVRDSKLAGKGSAFQLANFNNARLLRTTIHCDSPTAFQGVKLNDTELFEADLSTIDPSALESCEFDATTPPRYDAKTKFPEGFDPEKNGWKLIGEP